MQLTIEKTCPHLVESWYQGYITICNGEDTMKIEIGHSHLDYHDCRISMEKFVEAFAKNGVNILHSAIYKYYT